MTDSEVSKMMDTSRPPKFDVEIKPHLMSKQQLDEHVRALKQEYKTLEDEAARVHARLTSLRAKQAIFAPVYTLSDDVLAYIIEEACMHDCDRCFDDFWRCHGYVPVASPRTICNISRRFRSLALALPRIWRCIHIGNQYSLSSRYSVMQHLQMSRDMPLAILLDYTLPASWLHRSSNSDSDTEEDYELQDAIQETLDYMCDEWRAVCEQSYRWEYLCIPVDVLDTKDERHIPDPESSPDLQPPKGLRMVRSFLTELRQSFSLTYQDRQQPSRLSNVTTLMLHRPHPYVLSRSIKPKGWCRFLEAVPNLQVIAANNALVSHIASPANIRLGRVTLPKLRFASFRKVRGRPSDEPNTPQDLLPFISTPALRTVHLNDVVVKRLQHLFLGFDFQHVKQLGIFATSCRSVADFKWLLSLVPKLTSLATYRIRQDHDRQVAVLSDRSILPHLDTLAVASDPNTAQLEGYVQARISAKHPLKKLRIQQDTPRRAEFDAAFGESLVLEYFDYQAEYQRIWGIA